LKNIIGLWMVQECRRDLERQGNSLDYAALTAEAAESEPFRTLLDTTHAPFTEPGDMLAKIAAYAGSTGQPVPESPGQFIRACLESLAIVYRQTLDMLEEILERKYEVLHVVGGGGKNTLLNQMTADATQRIVKAGPYEATAIGNILTQAIGAGDVADLSELRRIVANSFEVETYEPQSTAEWQAAGERMQTLIKV
jgi:rhamnulokinase